MKIVLSMSISASLTMAKCFDGALAYQGTDDRPSVSFHVDYTLTPHEQSDICSLQGVRNSFSATRIFPVISFFLCAEVYLCGRDGLVLPFVLKSN